ncbi:MAG: BatA and WFA domain-containing protein [Chloroflexi bacterium]|nr:BatA and WFA domain-containing protein [Chloroflexota bacterium]
MSFLTPAFLLLGLLAVPIIVMYMLRLRRREVTVSSTLLWQKLLRDREANAPWQKLRRNLLLILQLLILAALVLALARPFLPSPSVITGSTVVLLDGSASMQATDAAPSRFAAAKTEAAQLIGDLSGGSQMTLIQVGHTPTVLASASSDKTALRRALDAAQPENGPPDWPAALALAAGAAQGFADGRIIIISDGGLPADLPPLPTTPLYLPIGSSAENLAISALATRPTASGPQLFASVANQGAQDREALLSLELDGALYDSRRVPIPANGSANLTWDLPEGTAVITARLSDNEGDNLPLDDVATAVHEGGVTNRALLITEGNLFLEQVFSVLPGIEAFKAAPGTDLTQETYDLLVFDGVPLPSPLPQADMLLINPPPGSGGDLFSVGGVFSDTVAVRLADSPLLQFVDWRDVHIRQATAVDAPWARPLVEASGGPLLLTGEQNGQRIALLTFDLRDSDLPLQIAFPILMANITGWLSPGRAFDAPAGLRPGDPVTISPSASATAVIVEKPDGRVWTADVGEDALIFAETNQLGLYRVSLRDEQGTRPAGSFAVNLFSPAESAIQPAASLSIGQVTADTTAEGNVGQREWWPWLVAVAILILMVEWWIQHRGPSFPRP